MAKARGFTAHFGKLGEYTFAYCSALAAINLPAEITEIPNSAFQGDMGPTDIEIPNNVVTIGNSAFQNTGLQRISIPPSVREIKVCAFRDTRSLQKVTFETNEEKADCPACIIGVEAFRGAGIESLEIPERVSSLGAYAFADCVMLQSVSVPQETMAGSAAFWGCKKLASDSGAIVVDNILFGFARLDTFAQFGDVLTRSELLTPLAIGPDVPVLAAPMYQLPEIIYRPSEASDSLINPKDLQRGDVVAFGRFPTDTDFALNP